ncbi:hypothetical protein ACQKJG_18120 [Priestia megaterium]|uniref:hypothetical protein n=1 Tax=Priestia megaterium TaxID=1404 RepID=UPI003D021616
MSDLDLIKFSMPELRQEQLEVIIEDAKNRITTHSVGDITPGYIERQQEIIQLAQAQLTKIQKEKEVPIRKIQMNEDGTIDENAYAIATIRSCNRKLSLPEFEKLMFSMMGVPEKYFERDHSSPYKKEDKK